MNIKNTEKAKKDSALARLLQTEVCCDFGLLSAHSLQILQPNSVPMRGGRRRILTDILQRHAPPRRALTKYA